MEFKLPPTPENNEKFPITQFRNIDKWSYRSKIRIRISWKKLKSVKVGPPGDFKSVFS